MGWFGKSKKQKEEEKRLLEYQDHLKAKKELNEAIAATSDPEALAVLYAKLHELQKKDLEDSDKGTLRNSFDFNQFKYTLPKWHKDLDDEEKDENYAQGWREAVRVGVNLFENKTGSSSTINLIFNLSETSPEEISEIISCLSYLYASEGGDRLEIKKMDTFSPVFELEPQL